MSRETRLAREALGDNGDNPCCPDASFFQNQEDCPCPESRMTHVHEYEGSVRLAELEEDPHNHRFAGETGEAIETADCNHIHQLRTYTDFYDNHFHTLCDVTGPAVPVGADRHVHFIASHTTVDDGHFHDFLFATLIENPIGDDNCKA